MNRIHVVAAVIYGDKQGLSLGHASVKANHILISCRPKHLHQGGLWEFPGGKLEADEKPYDGLARELKEELGIEVIKALPLMKINHDYPDKRVSLDVWTVTEFNGQGKGLEGQRIQWAPLTEINNFPFPEANQVILQRILR